MFQKNLTFFKGRIVIGLLFLIGSPAFILAQEEVSTNERFLEMESMTVTANKREENIREIPAPITAFSETDVEDAGIEDMDGILDHVPGISMATGGHGSEINFRGINTSVWSKKNPVVLYSDGVPCDIPQLLDAELNNIERIEVLRGPQGTLYGKNAVGGVVNIITKKPGNTFGGKASVELGTYDTKSAKVMVNGPLVPDKLFFGLSAGIKETGGYLENDHPDQDYVDATTQNDFKGTLRWTPGSKAEVILNVGVMQNNVGGEPIIAGDDIDYNTYRNPDDEKTLDTSSASLSIQYQFDQFDFHSITTTRSSRYEYDFDYGVFTASYANVGTETTQSLMTQEIRFQSPGSSDFKWLVGLFYSQESIDDDLFYDFNTRAYYGYNMTYRYPTEQTEKTMAVFGQATVSLSDSLDLTAGLRQEITHKEMDFNYELSRMDTGALLGNTSYEIDDDWSATLPKLVLTWNIDDEKLVYGSVADGYQAGGFNTTEDDKTEAKFDAQTSRNYEIGTKTSFMNNKIVLDALVYYIDINDMQVMELEPPNNYIATNAGKAHSQGVELEIGVKPISSLILSAALSTIDAEFDKYVESGVDYNGNTPPRTPESITNLSVQYRHESGIFVYLETMQQGKTYYDSANNVSQDAYQIFNTKIGYEQDNWDVYLKVKNLTDTEYAEAYSPDYNTIPYVYVGDPRTISISASARF